MTASYDLSGSVRLQFRPEVAKLVEQINEEFGGNFEVLLEEFDDGTYEFTLSGGDSMSWSGCGELDTLLDRLGKYALEGAVFTGNFEYEPCERVLGRTRRVRQAAYSAFQLEEIRKRLLHLLPRERKLLLADLKKPMQPVPDPK